MPLVTELTDNVVVAIVAVNTAALVLELPVLIQYMISAIRACANAPAAALPALPVVTWLNALAPCLVTVPRVTIVLISDVSKLVNTPT